MGVSFAMVVVCEARCEWERKTMRWVSIGERGIEEKDV